MPKKKCAPRSLLYYHVRDASQDPPRGWGTGIRPTYTVSRVCLGHSVGVRPQGLAGAAVRTWRETAPAPGAVAGARVGRAWAWCAQAASAYSGLFAELTSNELKRESDEGVDA